jgi:hypothetical protein
MSSVQPHLPSNGSGHQEEGTNVRLVTIWVVALFILTFVAFAISIVFHKGFMAWSPLRQEQRPVSPLAQLHRVPPEPRLQSNTAIDMARWQEIENNLVSSYGWIDAPKGRVRIPVSRAIELVAQEGLPARKGAPQP